MATPMEELAIIECGAFAAVPWLQMGVVHRVDKNSKAATIAKPFAVKNITAEQITVTLEDVGSTDFIIDGYDGPFILDAGMSATFRMQWTASEIGPVRQRLNVQYGHGQGRKSRLASMIIAGECKQGTTGTRRAEATRRPLATSTSQQPPQPLLDRTNTAVVAAASAAAFPKSAARQPPDAPVDIPVQIYLPSDRPKPSAVHEAEAGGKAQAGGKTGRRDVPVQIYAPQARQSTVSATSMESELDRELAAAFAAFGERAPPALALPTQPHSAARDVAGLVQAQASTHTPSRASSAFTASVGGLSMDGDEGAAVAAARRPSRGPPPAFLARMQARQAGIDRAKQAKQQGNTAKAEASIVPKRGRSVQAVGRQRLGFTRPRALKLEAIVPPAAADARGGIAAGAGVKRARVLAPAWQASAAAGGAVGGFGSPALHIYEPKPRGGAPSAADAAGLSLSRTHSALLPVPSTPGQATFGGSSTVLLFSPAFGGQGRMAGRQGPPTAALRAFGLAPPPSLPQAAAGASGAQPALFTPAARSGSGAGSRTAGQLMSPSAQAYAGLLSPRQAAKLTFGISKKKGGAERQAQPVHHGNMPVELGSPITWAKLARGVPMGEGPGEGSASGHSRKGRSFRFSKAANDRRQRAAAAAPATRAQGHAAPSTGHPAARAAPPLSRHARYVPVTVTVEGQGSKGGQAREEAVLAHWLNSLLAPGVPVPAHASTGAASSVSASSSVSVPPDATAAVIRGAAAAYAGTATKLSSAASAFVAGQERSIRTQALKVLMSGPVASASASLRRDMDCGRMQAKPDVNPLSDQTLRSRLTSLLLSTYHPSWLALGLEVVYGTPSLSKALQETQAPAGSGGDAAVDPKAGRGGMVMGAGGRTGAGGGTGLGPKRASSQALRGRTASFRAPPAMTKPLKRASSAPMLSQSRLGASSATAGPGHTTTSQHAQGGKGTPAIATREACSTGLCATIKRFLDRCFLVDQQACARAVRLQSKRKEYSLTAPDHVRAQQQTLLTRVFTLIMFLDKARSGGEGQTALVLGTAGSKRSEGASLVSAGRSLASSEPRLPAVAMEDGKALVEVKETAQGAVQQGKRTACAAASTVMEALTRYELPPCLFLPTSPHKSSKAVACGFAKEVLRGEGDVMRHLAGLGFELSTVQTKLDELVATPSAWLVQDVRMDLRDGARLVRLAEALAALPALSLCRAHLRVPAVSRTTKIQHVQKALECLAERLGLNTSGRAGGSLVHPYHASKQGGSDSTTRFIQRVSFGRKGKVVRTVTVDKASKGRVSLLMGPRRGGIMGGARAGHGASGSGVQQRQKVLKRTVSSSMTVRAGLPVSSSASGTLSTPIRVLPADVVDGDVERTKALLWTLLEAHSQGGPGAGAGATAAEGVPTDLLDAEVNNLCMSSAAAAAYICLQGARGPQSPYTSEAGPVCATEGEAALLRWLQAAAAAASAGSNSPVHVRGWSGVGIADGRALCLLLSRYQPRLLARKTVSLRGTTATLLAPHQNEPGKLVFRPGVTQAQAAAALAVERSHFRSISSALSALGCGSITVQPPSCDAAHPPDARLVKALLAVLARRLLVDNAEGKAARTIQRWVRGVQAVAWATLCARTRTARQLACAIKIGNWYKALLPLAAWREQRRRAATVLSAAWRALQARRQLYRLRLQAYHTSMVEVKRQAKAMEARQALQQLRAADRYVAAARVFQRAWRHRQDCRAERAWKAEQARFVARVTLVQAAARGWRVRFRPALNARLWGLGRQVSVETLKGAAQIIQDSWRCCLAGRQLEALRERRDRAALHAQEAEAHAWAASAIAAWWKGRVARAQFIEAQGAANMIASAWRGFCAQRRFTAMRTVATVVGRWHRGRVAASRLQAQSDMEAYMQHQAATRIVAWAKGVRARYACGCMRFAAVLCQSFWRGWRVRQDYLLYRAAACVVQRAWRAHSHRLRARKQRIAKAVTVVQAAYRGRLVRARVGALLACIRGAVTRLQAMVRGAQARRRVAEMLHARQVAERRAQLEAQMLRDAIADASPARPMAVPSTPRSMPLPTPLPMHRPTPVPLSAGVGPKAQPMATPAVAAITALRSSSSVSTAPPSLPHPPAAPPVSGAQGRVGGQGAPLSFSTPSSHGTTPKAHGSTAHSGGGNTLFLSPPVPLAKPVPLPAPAAGVVAMGGGSGRSLGASGAASHYGHSAAAPLAVDLSLSFDAEEEEDGAGEEQAWGAAAHPTARAAAAVDVSLLFDKEPDYEPSTSAATARPPLPRAPDASSFPSTGTEGERAVQQAKRRGGGSEPAPIWVASPSPITRPPAPAHAFTPAPQPAVPPMRAPFMPTPGRTGLPSPAPPVVQLQQTYMDTLASAKQAAYEAALLASARRTRAATVLQSLWRGKRDRGLAMGMRVAAMYRKQREEALQQQGGREEEEAGLGDSSSHGADMAACALNVSAVSTVQGEAEWGGMRGRSEGEGQEEEEAVQGRGQWHGAPHRMRMQPFGFGLMSSSSNAAATGLYAVGTVLAAITAVPAAAAAPVECATPVGPAMHAAAASVGGPAPAVPPATTTATPAALTRTDSSSTLSSVASFLGSVGGLGLSVGVGLVAGVVSGVVQGVKAVGGHVPGPGALLPRRGGREGVWESGSASTDESDVSDVEEVGVEEDATDIPAPAAPLTSAAVYPPAAPSSSGDMRPLLFSPGQFGDESMLLDKTVADGVPALHTRSTAPPSSSSARTTAPPGGTPLVSFSTPSTPCLPVTGRSAGSGSSRGSAGVKPWHKGASIVPAAGTRVPVHPTPPPSMPQQQDEQAPPSSGSRRAVAYAAARQIATLEANAIVIQATVRCWLAYRARITALTQRSVQAAQAARATYTVATWMFKQWRWRKSVALLQMYMLGALREAKRRRSLACLARQAASLASARQVMRAMAHARAQGQLVAQQAAVSAHQKAAVKEVGRSVVEEAARMAALRLHTRDVFRSSVCAALPPAAARMAAKAAHRQMGRQVAHAAADRGRGRSQPAATATLQQKEQAARAAQSRIAELKTQALRSVALRRKLNSAATGIQAAFRGFLARLQYSLARGTVLLLQAWVRGCWARARVHSLRAERDLHASLQQERARQAHEASLLRQRGPAPLLSARASNPVAQQRAEREGEEWMEATDFFSAPAVAAPAPVQPRWVGRASITLRQRAAPLPPWAQPAAPQVMPRQAQSSRAAAAFIPGVLRLQAVARGVLTRASMRQAHPALAHIRMRARNAGTDRDRGVTLTLGQRWERALAQLACLRLPNISSAVEDMALCMTYCRAHVAAFLDCNAAHTLYALLPEQSRTSIGYQLVRKMLAVLLTVAEAGPDKGSRRTGKASPPVRLLATQAGADALMRVIGQHHTYLPVVRPALCLLRLLLQSSSNLRTAFCAHGHWVGTVQGWARAWAAQARILDATSGPGKTVHKQVVMKHWLGIEAGREDYSAEGTAKECAAILACVMQPLPAPTVPVPFNLSGSASPPGKMKPVPQQAAAAPPPFASPSKAKAPAVRVPVGGGAVQEQQHAAFMSPPKVTHAYYQRQSSKGTVSPREAPTAGSPRATARVGMGVGGVARIAPTAVPFRPVGVNISPPKGPKAALAPLPTNAMRLVPTKAVSSGQQSSTGAGAGSRWGATGAGGGTGKNASHPAQAGAENDSLGALLNAPFTGTVGLVPVARRDTFA